jgi:hypothetical protein
MKPAAFETVYVEFPLTAEEAFWHGCTGTPIEPRQAFVLTVDPECAKAARVDMERMLEGLQPFGPITFTGKWA